jgi:hypothetical protein
MLLVDASHWLGRLIGSIFMCGVCLGAKTSQHREECGHFTAIDRVFRQGRRLELVFRLGLPVQAAAD